MPVRDVSAYRGLLSFRRCVTIPADDAFIALPNELSFPWFFRTLAASLRRASTCLLCSRRRGTVGLTSGLLPLVVVNAFLPTPREDFGLPTQDARAGSTSMRRIGLILPMVDSVC